MFSLAAPRLPRMANPFRMFVALMCAIHVRPNGSVYLFIMAIDEVDSFVDDGEAGDAMVGGGVKRECRVAAKRWCWEFVFGVLVLDFRVWKKP
jgi:hypothetical protein